MSDRVSNAEVEDVLSSIRRLVSEDHRGGRSRAKPVMPEATEDVAQSSDRLVLTPALRITTPPDDTSAEASENVFNENAGLTVGGELGEDAQSTPKSDLSIDSLVTDDVPFDPFTHRIDTDEDDGLANDDAHLATHPNDVAESAQNENEKTTIVELATQAAETEDVVEDIALEVADAEADVSTASAAADLGMTAEIVEEGAEDVPLDSSDVVDSASEETSVTPDVKAAALGAKIAALETAIGKISDTWEPDDAGESDYAGTQPDVMEWEDEKPEPEATPFARPMLAPVMRMPKEPEVEGEAVESDPVAQPFTSKRTNPSKPLTDAVKEPEAAPEEETDAARAVPEPTADFAETTEHAPEEAIAAARVSEDEQLIDEEALRDLVSDIVRAELQGALGERITRNVRKLVRREIHRALVAQEME